MSSPYDFILSKEELRDTLRSKPQRVGRYELKDLWGVTSPGAAESAAGYAAAELLRFSARSQRFEDAVLELAIHMEWVGPYAEPGDVVLFKSYRTDSALESLCEPFNVATPFGGAAKGSIIAAELLLREALREIYDKHYIHLVCLEQLDVWPNERGTLAHMASVSVWIGQWH